MESVRFLSKMIKLFVYNKILMNKACNILIRVKVCLLLSELSNTDNIRSVRLRSNQANFSRKSNFPLLIYRGMTVCGKEGENNIPVSCVVILERDGIVKVGFGYQNCRRIFFPCAIDYWSWPYWSRNPVKRTLSRR